MSSQCGPVYFPNISNAIINNPTITHISSPERHGMKLLLNNICQGAFHDAAERGDPPKCHPCTRLAIRAEIMEWVKAPEARRKLIIWMYGPAGSGKTAIAQSIAEECAEQGLLAASFFFSRTIASPGRNDTTRLTATLAYQLSRSIPEIRELIIAAIEEDPAIFSRALSIQMQVLVVNPLSTLPSSLKPVFVILDGIDECGPSSQSRTNLLDILGTVISKLKHIQLIFLISSRPEYEIRESFSGNVLSSLMRSLVLDDSYKPDEDIKVYFNSAFETIRAQHRRLGTHLPSPWPSKNAISSLVSKASGQFIFAATVIKFVDTPHHHPSERLDIILGLMAAGNETPFALLDALYRYILLSVANIPKVLEILTVLILPSDMPSYTLYRAKVIEELLDVEVHRALVDMHALVFVPPPAFHESSLRIHHASLSDFLTDRYRSRDLYISKHRGHIALCRRWLRMITKYQTYTWHLAGVSNIISTFIGHCARSPINDGIANDLGRFNLQRHLLDLAYNGKFFHIDWDQFFECTQRQGRYRADVFPRLQGDFDAFVLERISKYPPGIKEYIPTILATNLLRAIDDDFFHGLLHGISQSDEGVDRIRRLDSVLLNLQRYPRNSTLKGTFSALFRDRLRPGYFYVNKGSYAMLATQIVRVIFPRTGGDIQQAKVDSHVSVSHSTMNMNFGWFEDILAGCASTDQDLAMFLRERALQYRNDPQDPNIFNRGPIASACLTYIIRCGIPYLKHTHPLDTNKCVICEECNDASVIDLDLSDSPISALPPPILTSDLSPLDDRRVQDSTPPFNPTEIQKLGVLLPSSISSDIETPTAIESTIEASPVSERPTKSKRKRTQSSLGELRRSARFKVKRTASRNFK